MSKLGGWNISTESIIAKDEQLHPVKRNGVLQKVKKIRPLWLLLLLLAVVVVTIAIIVGALAANGVIKLNSKATADSASAAAASGSPTATASSTATKSTKPSSSATATGCSTSSDIPKSAKGTWMDPTSWLDMTDFNCTFTDETVGDLPIVGLNSTWDNSVQANPHVPSLNESWGSYASRPARGVNLGGWLALEPFITPSIFDAAPGSSDEYTLCEQLGSKTKDVLEKHYATFFTEDDFKSIAAAGLDHVRIPFSYWAIHIYDSDPYLFGVSWRYLLRGIEWARKYGLRVNLDLHAVPGSQNGWNHSGRAGIVNWILGPNGAQNAQRSLDLHDQLSKFFAQDRYKNIIAFYGLVNEPSMTITMEALNSWTEQAYKIVSDNGVAATQVFSESMRGLDAWQGQMPGYGDGMIVDVHQYTIFSDGLLSLSHQKRVDFACSTWAPAMAASGNTATGFGPTMSGEWSQADTDCAPYLNGVKAGSRWTGSFTGESGPACPTADSQCNCDMANADPTSMSSDYKHFLLTFAEAQMYAFEQSWGWFYWTWKTENAPLWSYQAGLEGGFMPPLAYQRDWDCTQGIPTFGGLPEYY